MSSDSTLPTPPKARRSDKENSSSPINRKGIEFAKKARVYLISPILPPRTSSATSIQGPTRSILKPSRPLLPIPTEKKRDITPLPDDGLANSTYLSWPVSVILNEMSTLRELTEAYSVLTSRIRSSVPPQFWVVQDAARHPLFNPLRRQSDALSSAIVRDLGRVFEDPFETFGLGQPSSSSFSPIRGKGTPSPKKGGMSEEQVKYARDLSTVSTATFRFLAMALTVPSIYEVFSGTCRRRYDMLIG